MSIGFTKELPVDADSTFAANSDAIVPSQKAVKTAMDLKASTTALNLKAAITDINVANSAYVKTATNSSGDAPIYSVRAWCNFQGNNNPPIIRASGNISSFIYAASGRYQCNFTTAMPDANYTAFITSDGTTNTINPHVYGYTTGYCSLVFFRVAVGWGDPITASVAFVR